MLIILAILGFRSRAAFKLIQLNRRFGFLQQSQVCVDLCAAPGGWMQVAKQNMPVSSIVIGIDLFAIKPIAGCISLTEDITTDKCRQALTKELKTWKADVVLNDGAPNVGRNWLFDAYQQICLALGAVKLSTEFLRPGGWFVTKVFRSKDYNAFVWVLKQLFKKVYATKPSASRKESAEIFVVCQGYKAPTKIDPKFLDPKYVFEELEIEPKAKVDLLKEPKTIKKPKAVGYDSVDLRKIITASEFLKAESALDMLQVATEIKFDDSKIEQHSATTDEIKECFKDIKVLGRKDLKDIIKWWKKLKEEFYPEEKTDEPEEEPEKLITEEDKETAELEEMEQYIQELKVEEQRKDRREKKKANKERAKLDQKLALKMVIKGDSGPQETQDEDVFNLREIKDKKVLAKFVDGIDITKKRDRKNKVQSKMVEYDENELLDDEAHIPTITSDAEDDSDEIEEELGLKDSSEDEGNDDNWNLRSTSKNGVAGNARKGGALERNRNPLLTDLDHRDKDSKRIQKAQLWFEKDAFKSMSKTEEADQDLDLDNLVKSYKKQGVQVMGEQEKPDLSLLGKKARRRARHQETQKTAESDDSDDDLAGAPPSDDEIDVQPKVKKIKLNEEELALGQMIATSKKMRRDLTDGAWNRYMFNDENLPDWFVEDEKNSMAKEIPVPSELITDYRKNLQEFNTRSIKKVMEAKARKKRQGKKRMEKIKKKAEIILENDDQTGQEKVKMLKKLYKKAEKKKQTVTYVVAKKTGIGGRKVRRPAGVTGQFRVVDPRLKKDLRGQVKAQKRGGGTKKKGPKGAKNANAPTKKGKGSSKPRMPTGKSRAAVGKNMKDRKPRRK